MTPPIIERIAAMRPVVRYAVSIGVALAAMLVRYALDPVLKTQSPYMVSLLGVFAAAWCCGLGPGLVAAAGGAVGATLFFLEPVFRLTVQPDEVLPLVLFCATAIGVAWITSELAALLRDLQNLQRVSDSALSSLEPTGSLDEMRAAVAADAAALLLHTDQPGGRIHVWQPVGSWRRSAPMPNPEDVQIPGVGSTAVFIADVRRAPNLGPALRTGGIRSLSAAPLVLGGRNLGGLCIGWKTRHHQTTRERDLIRVMSERVALAQDRHLLLLAEREARGAAEGAVTRTTEVLAAVSHELRQPLGPAAGWVQRLRAKSVDESTRLRGLHVIERNLTALARMVGDLLDLSRAATGKLTLDLQSTDLTPIVRDVVESVRRDATAKDVAIVVDVPVTLPMTADALRVQQVVANLMTNAVKFTPPGGLVRVSARRDDARLVLDISDTGVGIAPELLPRVFDRFEQNRAGEKGGLGLGLSIVRHLVELHAGTISARSAGLGQGATFEMVLPGSSGTANRATSQTDRSAAARPTGRHERTSI